MEWLIHRRLTCLFETYRVIPHQLSGFRRERSAVGTVDDIVLALEDAKNRRDTAHVVFLDVFRKFDSLPHAIILQQL